MRLNLKTDCKLSAGTRLYYNWKVAKVAELVDAPDLGSGAARRGGSSPSFRTTGGLDVVRAGVPIADPAVPARVMQAERRWRAGVDCT